MTYIQVTNPALMAQIDEFFQKRGQFIKEVKGFKEEMGLSNYNYTDNLYFGLILNELGVSSIQYDNRNYDVNIWCRKRRGKYREFVALQPYAKHKELRAQWDTFFEKEPFSYNPLTELLFKENICISTKHSPKLYYLEGHPLLIKMTNDYTLNFAAEPIELDCVEDFFQITEHDQNTYKKLIVIS